MTEGNRPTEGCIMRCGKDSNELAKLQAEESWSTLVDAAVIQEAIFSKLVSSSVAKHIIHHSKVFPSAFRIYVIASSKR